MIIQISFTQITTISTNCYHIRIEIDGSKSSANPIYQNCSGRPHRRQGMRRWPDFRGLEVEVIVGVHGIEERFL
jgi:hypothetical protein